MEQLSPRAQSILDGLHEVLDYVQGKPTQVVVTHYVHADAKKIREGLNMSQRRFADAFGIPLNTLQNWEQRRTNPDRTASAYLWAIAELPQQIAVVQQQHRPAVMMPIS
jgi:DNA-binding transcriptional regulator YiaG